MTDEEFSVTSSGLQNRGFAYVGLKPIPAIKRQAVPGLLNNHRLKAGGLKLRTESPDTRRLDDAFMAQPQSLSLDLAHSGAPSIPGSSPH